MDSKSQDYNSDPWERVAKAVLHLAPRFPGCSSTPMFANRPMFIAVKALLNYSAAASYLQSCFMKWKKTNSDKWEEMQAEAESDPNYLSDMVRLEEVVCEEQRHPFPITSDARAGTYGIVHVAKAVIYLRRRSIGMGRAQLFAQAKALLSSRHSVRSLQYRYEYWKRKNQKLFDTMWAEARQDPGYLADIVSSLTLFPTNS